MFTLVSLETGVPSELNTRVAMSPPPVFEARLVQVTAKRPLPSAETALSIWSPEVLVLTRTSVEVNRRGMS